MFVIMIFFQFAQTKNQEMFLWLTFSFFFSKKHYIYFSPVKSLCHKATNNPDNIDVLWIYEVFIFLFG